MEFVEAFQLFINIFSLFIYKDTNGDVLNS